MRLQVTGAAFVVSLVACGVAFAATGADVSAKPDLVVGSLSNPPSVAFQAKSFTVKDTTRNAGGATAARSVTTYYLSRAGHRTAAGRRAVPRLGPKRSSTRSATVSVSVAVEVGTYSLVACADGTHVVKESNERDNCRTAATKVVVKKPPSI
jgi:subtilase family serine protease